MRIRTMACAVALALAACAGADDAATSTAPVASEAGPVTTASGLVYEELRAGQGESPSISSTVKAHYHGTLADGSVFDSSVDRGDPLVIPLNRVIKCWQEGIPMMKLGGKAKLTCPAAIAYGERGVGSIPAGATLTFEVELLEILR